MKKPIGRQGWLMPALFIVCMLMPAVSVTAQSYTGRDVLYYNADSSIRFGGTLTIPNGAASCPAVLILSGTGQQDRNGTMAGHPMFAVIADSLSRHGIAVLRVDDRGKNETTGDYATTTTREFAADALAGIRFLQQQTGIDKKNIGLIGHSEGGAAACIAASESHDVAFVVSLSAPGVSGLDALLAQNRALVNGAHTTETNKKRFNSINEVLFRIVYNNADAPNLEAKLRAAYNEWRRQDSVFIAGLPKKESDHFFFPFEGYLRQATGRWYRGFITYEPSKVLPLLRVPVLAINGDKDIISDADVNLEGFKRYTRKKLLQTWRAPGLNHLYQHCLLCTTNEYNKLPEAMAPEVIERITQFIKTVTKSRSFG